MKALSKLKNGLFLTCFLALFATASTAMCEVAPSGNDTNQKHAEAKSDSDIATKAIQRGTEALAVRDYETAFAEYRAAVDALSNDPTARPLRKVALDDFTKAAMGLAEQRIAEGRWADARSTVERLLQYQPNYKPAKELLEHLDEANYFNKTVTPDFVYRVEQVKRLLVEGQGLLESGRFDEAQATFDSILKIDRYNVAAWQGIEQVNKAKRRVADVARKATEPLMPNSGNTPGLWPLIGLLIVVLLAGLALLARYRFKSNSTLPAGAASTGCDSLLSWCWLILAVATLVFFSAYSRYEFVPVSSDIDHWVLKIDRWTGAIDRVAY